MGLGVGKGITNGKNRAGRRTGMREAGCKDMARCGTSSLLVEQAGQDGPHRGGEGRRPSDVGSGTAMESGQGSRSMATRSGCTNTGAGACN